MTSIDMPTESAIREVRVWDPLVRIFHWSLVALFLIAYLSGDEASQLHLWSGYGVLALVGVRVLWGLVGTRHARFGNFVRGPATIARYLKELLLARPRRYLGHNPLGGAMIVLMLATLGATAASGVALQQMHNGGGAVASAALALRALAPAPLAAAHADDDDDDDDEAEWLEELHEFLAQLMVVLVLLHVAGVAVGSAMHRENLIRAMFTGRKPV